MVSHKDRKTVDHPDDRAFRDERLIFLASLDHPVCDLLFERTRDPLRVQDMLRRDEGRRLFLCDITRDADQSAKLAEPQGELTAASSSPLSLPQDLEHSCPVEVGNLAIFRDLLG